MPGQVLSQAGTITQPSLPIRRPSLWQRLSRSLFPRDQLNVPEPYPDYPSQDVGAAPVAPSTPAAGGRAAVVNPLAMNRGERERRQQAQQRYAKPYQTKPTVTPPSVPAPVEPGSDTPATPSGMAGYWNVVGARREPTEVSGGVEPAPKLPSTAVAGQPAPTQPDEELADVQTGQGTGLGDIADILGMGKDSDPYEAARARVAALGMKEPGELGKFNMSPWAQAAVILPNLLGAVTGDPFMGYGTDVMAKSWIDERDREVTTHKASQTAYQKAMEHALEREEDLGLERGKFLAPYIMPTAYQSGQLDMDQAKLGLERQRVALAQDNARWGREWSVYQHMNPSAAERVKLQMQAIQADWTRAYQAAQVAISQGNLEVARAKLIQADQHFQQAQATKSQTQFDAKKMVETAYLMAVTSGQPVDPALQSAWNAIHPGSGAGNVPENVNMLLNEYMNLTKDPVANIERIKAMYPTVLEAAKRHGLEVAVPSPEELQQGQQGKGFWGRVQQWWQNQNAQPGQGVPPEISGLGVQPVGMVAEDNQGRRWQFDGTKWSLAR